MLNENHHKLPMCILRPAKRLKTHLYGEALWQPIIYLPACATTVAVICFKLNGFTSLCTHFCRFLLATVDPTPMNAFVTFSEDMNNFLVSPQTIFASRYYLMKFPK